MRDELKGLEVSMNCHIQSPREPLVEFGEGLNDSRAFSFYLSIMLLSQVKLFL